MKVAVITGSNKGIGFAIVRALCENFEGTVYLTARDVKRGETAIDELKKDGLKAKFHQLDIDDQNSINKFRDFIKKQHGGLDILVNNAAIAYPVESTVPFAEQAENTIRVNFFGTLATCKALFPLLRDHARVVNLSSCEGHLLKIPGDSLRKKFSNPNLTEEDLCDLMRQFVESTKKDEHQKQGWRDSAYGVSKVGVTALTFIQQKAFDVDERTDIIVNAVHPGFVSTDMSNHKGPLTVEQGADAPVYLALLPPGTSSPRGEYVWCDRQIVDWFKGPTPAPY